MVKLHCPIHLRPVFERRPQCFPTNHQERQPVARVVPRRRQIVLDTKRIAAKIGAADDACIFQFTSFKRQHL
jgi:hypothetical protein